MKMIASILVGAAMIAAALLFVFPWEITTPHVGLVYRLDRWTGNIALCQPDPGRAHDVRCEDPDDWQPVAAVGPTVPPSR
jgi:hypothetical protein